MGLFDLFRKDPGKELDRARTWLAGGDPVRALHAARRFANHDDPDHRSRAQALVDEARQAVIASTLERAGTAEAEGDPADAAEWVASALEHVRDEGHRSELQQRLTELRRRAEQKKVEVRVPEVEAEERDEVPEVGGFEMELDTHYATLTNTLDEGVAERYEGRSVEFRRAYVALNEARTDEALQALDALVAADGADPVLRFERGRARLMKGEAAGAREDFEAAWPELGDDPLDLAGSLTVPALWAEAALEQGEPEPVLERLEELAHPRAGNPDLIQLYGRALLAAERPDEARRFLAAACQVYPRDQDLSHLLGQALARVGERGLAIQALETAIAPSCASGSCSKPPLHPPSLRTLAALHLEEGTSPDRVEDLLRWISRAQNGRFLPPDLLLVARLHEQQGDEEKAREARARAAELSRQIEQGQVAATGAAPELGMGKAAL